MGSRVWDGPLKKYYSRVKQIHEGAASVQLNAYTYNARVVPVTSYVAQLVPLPKELAVQERVAMHTVLRAPINSMRHADFFHLHEFGGPKLRSLTASCASALYRTAAKTIHKWPAWIKQLDTAAMEFLPTKLYIEGVRTTNVWDSTPIAINLQEAFHGFPGDPRWSAASNALIQKFTQDNQGNPPAPGSKFFQETSALQKVVYGKLMEYAFSCSLKDLLVTRINMLFEP